MTAHGLFSAPPFVHPMLAGHGHVDFSSFSILEWAVVCASALFVMWSIWRAIDLTAHPGEDDPTHIKRTILTEPPSPEHAVSSRPPRKTAGPNGGGAP